VVGQCNYTNYTNYTFFQKLFKINFLEIILKKGVIGVIGVTKEMNIISILKKKTQNNKETELPYKENFFTFYNIIKYSNYNIMLLFYSSSIFSLIP
jgi:hypothetical protein